MSWIASALSSLRLLSSLFDPEALKPSAATHVNASSRKLDPSPNLLFGLDGLMCRTMGAKDPLLQEDKLDDANVHHYMNAIIVERVGAPLKLKQVEVPRVGDDEVLIKIERAAVNRIDIDERMGGCKKLYEGIGRPGPKSVGRPGIECAGSIIAVGKNVKHWNLDDKVCAVLDGEGYAEQVAVSANLVLPIPSNLTMEEAACLPEAAMTGWRALCTRRIDKNSTLLIHENCGDIGIFVVQMAKYMGAKVYVIAGSAAKKDFYKKLGADECINHKTENIHDLNDVRKGVDLILDSWPSNLEDDEKVLGYRGTIIIVDLHYSSSGIASLSNLLRNQAELRAFKRSNGEERENLIQQLRDQVWPVVEKGFVKPVVHRSFPLSEAAKAHRVLTGTDYKFFAAASWLGPFGKFIMNLFYTGKIADDIFGKIVLEVQ